MFKLVKLDQLLQLATQSIHHAPAALLSKLSLGLISTCGFWNMRHHATKCPAWKISCGKGYRVCRHMLVSRNHIAAETLDPTSSSESNVWDSWKRTWNQEMLAQGNPKFETSGNTDFNKKHKNTPRIYILPVQPFPFSSLADRNCMVNFCVPCTHGITWWVWLNYPSQFESTPAAETPFITSIWGKNSCIHVL